MSKVLSTAVNVFFLTYVAARAIRVPFTYDEAATYFRFIAADPLALFSFPVATNHLLNTLLAKLAYTVGGSAEWVLRLPSVLAFAVFAWFSMRLMDRLANRAIALAGLVLLLSNPFLLEFFALSRGYGPSIALLFGSLCFLLRFLDDVGAAHGSRSLAWALGLAVLAVAANFTMLNLAMGVFGIALVVSMANHRRMRRSDRAVSTARVDRLPWQALAALALFAAGFVPAVLSQDLGLSERLYQPVTVTVEGPDSDRVVVHRLDARGRASRLSMEQGTWALPRRQHVAGLRIESPRDADPQQITAVIGDRRIHSAPHDRQFWTAYDRGALRIYESTPALSIDRSLIPTFGSIINWSGDAIYARQVATRTAVVLTLLVLLAGLLEVVGRLLRRVDLLPLGDWRAIAVPLLWLVSVAAIPLYLLKRNGELYFGGTEGFLEDTVGSLIADALYGTTYAPNQSHVVSAVLLLIIAAAILGVVVQARRPVRPQSGLATVLTLTVVAVVVQLAEQVLLGTPSLIGRTALFYIPLVLLLTALSFDAVASLGRVLRAIAVATMVVGAAAAVAHFANTANVTHTRDWQGDASTRLMIEDLEQAAGRPAGSRVRLAVYPFFYPVTRFYAGKSPLAIDVEVVPARGGSDFLFLRDGSQEPGMEVVSRYSLTRNVLVRARPSP